LVCTSEGKDSKKSKKEKEIAGKYYWVPLRIGSYTEAVELVDSEYEIENLLAVGFELGNTRQEGYVIRKAGSKPAVSLDLNDFVNKVFVQDKVASIVGVVEINRKETLVFFLNGLFDIQISSEVNGNTGEILEEINFSISQVHPWKLIK